MGESQLPQPCSECLEIAAGSDDALLVDGDILVLVLRSFVREAFVDPLVVAQDTGAILARNRNPNRVGPTGRSYPDQTSARRTSSGRPGEPNERVRENA